MKADLTYSSDGIWTRFYPETQAGIDAYNVMAAADEHGVVAFLPPALPGVLLQLRSAGLSVRKGSAARLEDIDDAALLEELGA